MQNWNNIGCKLGSLPYVLTTVGLFSVDADSQRIQYFFPVADVDAW